MPTEEEIKEQLTECYEQKLPVLLTGDSPIDYVDLVIQIHKANGGKEESWEYFGSDKSLNSTKAMAEGVKKAIDERDYARMDEILGNCKSTSATMASFDWSAYDCNALYKQLILKDGFRDLNHMLSHINIECLGVQEHLGGKVNMFLDYEPHGDGTYWPLSSIRRKGLLFIINLFCQTEEDKRIYERLAPYIKDRKDNDHKSGDWLVMHTHDPSGFPEYFIKQFVEIPLDGENEEGKIEEFAAGTRQTNDYEFLLEGEYWKITYEGKTINLRNSKGLQYIHYLLNNPGKEFQVLVLVHEIMKSPPPIDTYNGMSKEQTEEQLIEDGLSKGSTGEVIDERAINEYKDRYNELEDELEDETIPKSDERIAEIREEIEKISKALIAGRDKHGHPRKVADDAEKARKAVSKAIKESLDKIKDEQSGHSALWRHFVNTLTIGTSCSYKPESPIHWNL